jgi:signal transduction histidine kinase
LKPKAASHRQSAIRLPAEALSAVIAHELNNIAVPLRGFIDLDLQTMATDDPVRHSHDELHVGLDRIRMLADQLESLGQQGFTLSPTAIGSCLASLERGDLEDPKRLVWSCSTLTPVKVDKDHVRRAVISLMDLAGSVPLLIRESALDGLACAACEKPIARGRVFVQIQARGLRPAIFAAIRAPFEASQKLRAMQRLAIAALSHCGHLAGCHVVADPGAESLSIVLPRLP